MNKINKYIDQKINARRDQESLRRLRVSNGLVDFCSNDYLGFSSSADLKEKIRRFTDSIPDSPLGSTGSRLISGNDSFTEELEAGIASFHSSEASLLYNSGYDANLGIFSSLPQKGDTIITDELAHASIIDGARLSFANRYTFRHNDLQSLEDKLKAAKGRIYIAVESIYSMDGDEAPLVEIAKLTERYEAGLIVDEAHATGIFGIQGRGLVSHYQLENKVLARIITYGKALGSHGAAVVGNNKLKKYLVNFSRPFIYTTAASFHAHLCIKMAYQLLQETDHQALIAKRVSFFKQKAEHLVEFFIPSSSPIQSLLIPGNSKVRHMAGEIMNAGFDVRPILHPTVAQGRERLRICLHTFNSEQDITALTEILTKLL